MPLGKNGDFHVDEVRRREGRFLVDQVVLRGIAEKPGNAFFPEPLEVQGPAEELDRQRPVAATGFVKESKLSWVMPIGRSLRS